MYSKNSLNFFVYLIKMFKRQTIHKDYSDEDYEYESDTEEDFKRGCTCCHHVNEKVRKHNDELHTKRTNKRINKYKNDSYEENIKKCYLFQKQDIYKKDNEYYTKFENKEYSLEEFDINDKSICYYDGYHFNILTIKQYGEYTDIKHYYINNLACNGICMTTHGYENIVGNIEEFDINKYDVEICIDRLYTDILIIFDKNTHEKLLLTNIHNLYTDEDEYYYEQFDMHKHFKEELRRRIIAKQLK